VGASGKKWGEVEGTVKKKASVSEKPAGWAWDLPRADEPQLAITFYEHLQLRLPKRVLAK
jgi:hypothetical protein